MKFIEKLLELRLPSSLYRYLFVGLTTAIVDMSLLALLFYAFHWQRQIAVAVSYIVGVMVHFTLNRYFTFRASNGFVIGQVGRYLIVLGISYFLTVIITEVGVSYFLIPLMITKAIAIGVTFWVGYILNRLWVFRPGRNLSESFEISQTKLNTEHDLNKIMENS